MRFPFRLGTLLRVISMAAFGLSSGPVANAGEIEGALSDPSRVVSIGGSLTEIVYALGEGKRLVARDQTSVYPEAALSLPDVGYMRQLSPEGVLSVDPTGILLLEGSGPREAIDVLKKARADLVSVPERFDREGILAKIGVVGKALGVEAKAEALAATVEDDLRAAEKLTAGIKDHKRVLFILSMQGGKLLAAGAGTASDGIIKLAGGVNVIDSFEGYKQVSDEAVITAQPDVILMMTRGGEHSQVAEELFAHPAIAPTRAGKAKALIRMDGAYLLGFGPRTASAARDLAKALYGDQVTD
ncbi:MAG TPA: hemin ABC transporter substrate-binding protein [Rhizobiaceae bacterium]|nr:hemin ABC transporter substrate-binding protein [Rhizobiaceae bacterium]